MQAIMRNNEAQTPALAHHAQELASTLELEFGVPFTFYDVRSGAATNISEVKEGRPALDQAQVYQLVISGPAQVIALEAGRYQLALLTYEAGEPSLLATGIVSGLAKTAAEAREELNRMQKWLEAVHDRLRLTDQLANVRRQDGARTSALSQNKLPWEALLAVDHVAHQLRIDKDPDKSELRVLESAFGFLGAAALALVPPQGAKQVLIHGDAGLSPKDWQQLAEVLTAIAIDRVHAPIFCDRFQEKTEGTRFPTITNLLALPVSDQKNPGWVIAVNKKGEAGFRKSDAALLTPFVGLIGLYERGIAHCQALKDLLVGLTRSLTTAIDAKDSYTFGHSERVARIAVELARELGLDANEQGDIYLAGLLHDVGKIGVRDEVLGKPGKLTPEEQRHIQQHVHIGFAILSDLKQIRNLLPGILYHHERYDGAGYPDGLAGEKIPLLARILAVADSYDAMTTSRPYRPAMPWAKVQEIFAQGVGRQWDERIINAFHRCRHKIEAIKQRGVGESLRHAIDGAIRNDSDPAALEIQEI
jgi:putative nucleotidyltransferase with HDIG domain